MWSSRVRIGLFAVDALTAVTATGGGIALAAGIEGDRFPDEWLKGTPFKSYRVPGMILAGVVGGSATFAAAATVRIPRAGGLASLLSGLILMGWIVGEIRMLNQPRSRGRAWEVFYFTLGLIMAVLGLTLGRATKRHPFLPRGGG